VLAHGHQTELETLFDLAATTMPRLTALKMNPNGIQIHQPRIGIRAGRQGAPPLGNRPHQLINAEGVAWPL
jgi:hypothetical protein